MGVISRLSTWGQWLTHDPVGFIIYLVYNVVCILLTLILHEVAHGYVAWRCGDPTAKMLGRLSLDPRKHLDPIGTVCMVLFGFGWAKPVPVNPRNFDNYRRDDLLVSLAGVTVNFTLYLLCTSLAVFLNGLVWKDFIINAFGVHDLVCYGGTGYAALVLGEDIAFYLQTPWLQYVQRFLLLFGGMNLCVAIFNLLPIPPLDGYHVLNDLLLRGRFSLSGNAFRITHVVLMALCFTGVLSKLLHIVIGFVDDAVVNLFVRMAGLG